MTGTRLAEMGNTVTCVDIDPRKIDMLNRGELPIYEPVSTNSFIETDSGRLKFTLELSDSIPESDVAFIAVGTPPDEDTSWIVVTYSKQQAPLPTSSHVTWW